MLDIFQTLFRFREKDSPDKLGLYPERVHIDAFPERRYLWTARLLVMISAFSICMNMILASTIYLLLPMIEVTPRFFRINDYFNTVDLVQPREIRFAVSDLITEENIRNYMIMRYTITDDYSENLSRWDESSFVYWSSASNVFSEFIQSERDTALMQFRKTGLQRFIDIDWVKYLSFGLWQVQFTTKEYFPDKPSPQTSKWRATLRVIYTNIPFPSQEERGLNPFGFLVASYSLSYYGNGQNQK